MSLSLPQLEKHLAGPELRPVYLLAGEEHLLLLEAADALRARARALGFSEREVLESAESGFEWYQLANAGANLSLFATRRLLDLRIPGGKPGKDGAEAIIEYCKSPPPDTLLLITATTWSKAHETAWVAAVERVGAVATFWPLKPGEMPAWISQRARKRGVVLSADAVEALVERVEGNLLAAAQEVDKLVLLAEGRTVDAALLEQLVSDNARFDVFRLADAALAGDTARALRIAASLRAEGEQVPGLLGWITLQLNVLVRAAAAIERGDSVDGALRSERVWQNRFDLYRAALRRGRSAYWESMLSRIAQVERIGKGRASGDAWRELERVLAMIAQPRAAQSLAPG